MVFSSKDSFEVILTSMVEMSKTLSVDRFLDNCCLERGMGRLVTGFMGRVEMVFMLDLENIDWLVLFLGRVLEGWLNVIAVVQGQGGPVPGNVELVFFMGRLVWIKGLLEMSREVFLGWKLGACLGLVMVFLKLMLESYLGVGVLHLDLTSPFLSLSKAFLMVKLAEMAENAVSMNPKLSPEFLIIEKTLSKIQF